MKTIKRQCNVVMLPTNEEAKFSEWIYPRNVDNKIKFQRGEYRLSGFILYITSGEEIKEGDHYIYPNQKCTWCNNEGTVPNEGAKKVIASTDTSLGLPQPSTAFIGKYISEYNKGNVIERVMVEYYKGHVNIYKETIPDDCLVSYFNEFGEFEGLKVSKDNTIITSKVKDSWSRDETFSIAFKAAIEFAKGNMRLGSELEDYINKLL